MSDEILICPVCRAPLVAGEREYRCMHGHSFDRARQGYVNLLLAQQKRARAPGDSAVMITSRTRFLDGGAYDRLADAVSRVVAAVLPPPAVQAVRILDAGCGEGFWLARIKPYLQGPGGVQPAVAAYGVDISKPAILAATRRDRAITWIVASAGALPVGDATLDLVLSIFAPPAFAEFARVLRPGGRLVLVTPGPRHLAGLRQILYPTVVPHTPDKWLAKAAPHFALVRTTSAAYEIDLRDPALVMDLLVMTPYFWHIDAAAQAGVAGLSRLQTPVDARISVLAVEARSRTTA